MYAIPYIFIIIRYGDFTNNHDKVPLENRVEISKWSVGFKYAKIEPLC